MTRWRAYGEGTGPIGCSRPFASITDTANAALLFPEKVELGLSAGKWRFFCATTSALTTSELPEHFLLTSGIRILIPPSCRSPCIAAVHKGVSVFREPVSHDRLAFCCCNHSSCWGLKATVLVYGRIVCLSGGAGGGLGSPPSLSPLLGPQANIFHHLE